MMIYQPLVPNPNWPKAFTFSPGVRVGNMIFLSGTTATDEKGRMVGKGDIVAQTRQIFRKFAAVLEVAGGSLANIVKQPTMYCPSKTIRRRQRFGARCSTDHHGPRRREWWSADWFASTHSLR